MRRIYFGAWREEKPWPEGPQAKLGAAYGCLLLLVLQELLPSGSEDADVDTRGFSIDDFYFDWHVVAPYQQTALTKASPRRTYYFYFC